MTFFKRIIYITTLNCRDATRLLSDQSERSLSFVERLALRGHLLVCRECVRFRRYLRVIDAALRDRGRDEPSAEDVFDIEGIPDDVRERIRKRLSRT